MLPKKERKDKDKTKSDSANGKHENNISHRNAIKETRPLDNHKSLNQEKIKSKLIKQIQENGHDPFGYPETGCDPIRGFIPMESVKRSGHGLAERLKSKFNLSKLRSASNSLDNDDPYAFPEDPVSEVSKPPPASPAVQPHLASPAREQPIVHPSITPPQTPQAPPTPENTSSMAKLYPELAEKLERARNKIDTGKQGKTTQKSSSRTMNRLQSKIAQNKIKDKLKRNQTSDQTTPEHHSPYSPAYSQMSPYSHNQFSLDKSIGDSSNSVHHPLSTTSPSGPHSTPPNSTSSKVAPAPLCSSSHLTGQVGSGTLSQSNSRLQASSASTSHPQVGHCKAHPQDGIPPPPPYHPPPYFQAAKLPFHCTRPQPPQKVLSGPEANKRLKTASSVKVYAYYASQRMLDSDLLPFDLDGEDSDSSLDDEIPTQKYWFSSLSEDSDSDHEKEEDGEDSLPLRVQKIGIVRSRLRRNFMQMRKAQRANLTFSMYKKKALLALIQAAKESPKMASRALTEIAGRPKKPVDRHKLHRMMKKKCCYKGDNDVQCTNIVLPMTNHCIQHIMYNVDQQLFDYCTAKFSDNTQCCVPVFDYKHELPLCPEHAAKADNYNKNVEPKAKKPRKKTKPSALTRPPKKGKKKKNAKKNVRPQKPMPPLEPSGDTEMPPVMKFEMLGGTDVADGLDGSQGIRTDVDSNDEDFTHITNNLEKDLSGSGLALSPGTIDKTLDDMPLDQDFSDVLNKLPDDAFNIFTGKNGDFVPTKEETEELELALAAASKDFNYAKESLEKLSSGQTLIDDNSSEDGELPKHIADDILNSQTLSENVLLNSIPNGSVNDQDNLSAIESSLSMQDLNSITQVLNSDLMTLSAGVSNGIPVSGQFVQQQPVQLQQRPNQLPQLYTASTQSSSTASSQYLSQTLASQQFNMTQASSPGTYPANSTHMLPVPPGYNNSISPHHQYSDQTLPQGQALPQGQHMQSPHVPSPHAHLQHIVQQSPHHVAHSPHQMGQSPHHMPPSPHHMAQSPHNMAQSPHHIVQSPHRMPQSPHQSPQLQPSMSSPMPGLRPAWPNTGDIARSQAQAAPQVVYHNGFPPGSHNQSQTVTGISAKFPYLAQQFGHIASSKQGDSPYSGNTSQPTTPTIQYQALPQFTLAGGLHVQPQQTQPRT